MAKNKILFDNKCQACGTYVEDRPLCNNCYPTPNKRLQERLCLDCQHFSVCAERVKSRLWVLCEFPDDHDYLRMRAFATPNYGIRYLEKKREENVGDS